MEHDGMKFDKRESWEISYTTADGNSRIIHVNNGEAHVHPNGESVRNGNASWEKVHVPLNELDRKVIKDTREYNGKDWWKK